MSLSDDMRTIVESKRIGEHGKAIEEEYPIILAEIKKQAIKGEEWYEHCLRDEKANRFVANKLKDRLQKEHFHVEVERRDDRRYPPDNVSMVVLVISWTACY